MVEKADIRRHMLKVRDGLGADVRRQKSERIQEKIGQLPEFQRAEWVFLYMDYASEVQTGILLEQALALHKHVALPKVMGSDMEFFEIHARSEVQKGYKGIMEPEGRTPVLPEYALVIVPGVAFSRLGQRLGYGKGFYDRYLARHPEFGTCAAAYECQVLDRLPAEEHDILLQQLITEGSQ